MTYKEIVFSTEGAIAMLTLNSPTTINASIQKNDRRDDRCVKKIIH